MRFMMFMIPEVYQGVAGKNLPSDFAPGTDDVKTMMKYNDDLARAGALISLDGLHPIAKGARVSFSSGKPSVTDGPFTETKEVVGGYWMIQVGSKQEAIDWARRVPARPGDVIEIRQVFDMSDFPADVQEAVDSAVVKDQLAKQKA